jgi:acetyl esterase/lipase
LPGAGWCISPWLDLTSRIGRISSNVVRDPIVFADVLDTASHIYLNGHSAHDPLVAPSSADLRGVPPLLLQVGSGELLLDDSLQLAKLAEIAGVDVTLEIWPDMLHAWHLFAGTLSEAAEATHRGAEWLDRKLSS